MAPDHRSVGFAQRLRQSACHALFCAGALGVVACRTEPRGQVSLVLGNAPGDKVSFDVRSAFAEYLYLPELRHELRLTLTSYEASCDDHRAPSAGDAAVIVTVATPPQQPPRAGLFDWAGHDAHGGTIERPERAYAVPVARVGERGYEFRPGGGIELRELGTAEGARVRGVLSFEFPGDGTHPAQAVKGSFVATVCRTSAPGSDP